MKPQNMQYNCNKESRMASSSAAAATPVSCLELFNLLQAQKNWPSGGAPAVFDLRPDGERRRVIRGSFPARLASTGEVEVAGVAPQAWRGRALCLYADDPGGLSEHEVAQRLLKDGGMSALLVLSEPFGAFESAFPFLCAKETSSKASKRPLCPSCVVPNLVYLGDLTDAAALPRLREQLNVQRCVTALAELPPSLKASVSESRVSHTWCNVRDVEDANIKEHFSAAYEQIEAAREAGHAVFVHCSRGVSRSASLVIAYLMRKEGATAADARARVEACRPIVLPNDGFVKCLAEYEKELSGERTGVYIPAPKKAKSVDDDFEMPPHWAAPPTHTAARLVVEKRGESVESLPVGEHAHYTFGRSLTCDFPIEHPSASRNHATLVHHRNGGVYVIDLRSSHGTRVDGRELAPYEACRLREGSTVSFGASTRAYRLEGCAPPPPEPAERPPPAAVEGPALPGEGEGKKRKKKYTPEDYRNRKRKKWLDGQKSSARMSENERVARGAGSGSGCFGPGFD